MRAGVLLGFAEVGERPRDSVDVDRAGEQGSQVDPSLGDRLECAAELDRVVAEGELHRELLRDAEHRMDAVLLHAGTDDEDLRVAGRGAHGLFDHPGHPHCLEDDERAGTVDVAPRRDRALLAWVHDHVAPEVLGQPATPG
jgi:hypothetical protein